LAGNTRTAHNRSLTQFYIAEKEVWIMLFEPQNVKHTVDVKHELTVDDYEKI
jgi:hypothetical protein